MAVGLLPCETFPFLVDLRLGGGGDVCVLEGSSVGREEGLAMKSAGIIGISKKKKHDGLTRAGTWLGGSGHHDGWEEQPSGGRLQVAVSWFSGAGKGGSAGPERPRGDHVVQRPCVFGMEPGQRGGSRETDQRRKEGSLRQVSRRSE